VILYPVTVFLSAFLLFLVEPMMGKVVLPWFGGAPAVWSTVLLFFQVLLLLGYTYSHAIVRRLPLQKQGGTHVLVLAASALLPLLLTLLLGWRTPLTPRPGWLLSVDSPILSILLVLALGVGWPYFVLSTTSSLLQTWFSRRHAGQSPYRLYALSNAGSLLALLSYPFLVEPTFSVQRQAWLWSVGYLAFVACCGGIGFLVLRSPRGRAGRKEEDVPARTSVGILPPILWVALSACASMLLLATTNQMTQDLAPMPLLWVFPLAIYLLSFVLCFGDTSWYRRGQSAGLFITTFLYCGILVEGNRVPILFQLAVYGALLFFVCVICHGEIVRLRPGPDRLTQFYLLMALGGALGAVFVTLIAPLAFNNFWELPLGVVLCWILLALAWGADRRSAPRGRVLLPLALMILLAIGGLAFVSLSYIQSFREMALVVDRNFYGPLWVVERKLDETEESVYELGHGVTLHGMQYTSEDRRLEPTSYYCEESGIALAFLHYPRTGDGLNVGVVGLGVGTVTAYGRAGDFFRFYEINPSVTRVAGGEGGYFTYLQDSPAAVEVVSGDGRLALERELAAGDYQPYDVLVLDAFSSHAIPVHLLTRESFQLYLTRLKPEGVLAVHVSTPHVDLRPVLAGLADHFDLEAVVVEGGGEDPSCIDAMWVLMTPGGHLIDHPQIAAHGVPLAPFEGQVRLWTDSYSNIIQVLR
jgi:hypothetical protein